MFARQVVVSLSLSLLLLKALMFGMVSQEDA
jgi:hypothetical protein